MMTDTLVGILAIGAMFFFMILRTPVGLAMLIVGFFGTWILSGYRSAGALLISETYSATSNYALTVMPLFILMGNLSSAAGFSRRLYEAAFAWVGWLRGGLASASVIGCAAFAAVSGSSVATAVTIGRVALPEMKRFGYSDSLSTGAIAAGGTLGFLIPPSTGFVIYAILTEESIGRLFMAGILPGLLLTGLFLSTIAIIVTLKPGQGPKGSLPDSANRLTALLRAAPLLAVIVISIGGIYLGVFTPVEAAGVGAVLVAGMAFAGRLITLREFGETLMQTVRTAAMLYLIIIGANVLNPFLALTHIPSTLGESLMGAGLGPYGALALVVVAYLFLGMFMDGLAMLVVTVPIVFPLLTGMGFDPIWLGVIIVILIEMGMITPPVGLNVFVVKSVAADVPIMSIFKGVFPFWIAMLICLILLVAFPSIVLLLPNSMFG
ncbi:C4-dicarboxylate ABC transporter permease [Sinisalibacter aestuarii]|uniref:TRAP transporter large permease protein n=2 Tax=Sinisalibacter aestuarii TaxID=2949426 RepID=A0ABQ5LY81_9RHOB|nr:C4-dicarboxylate ABC transporter permease [Sinisalibacter aestuarii]